jgi:hypothetical protein
MNVVVILLKKKSFGMLCCMSGIFFVIAAIVDSSLALSAILASISPVIFLKSQIYLTSSA